jgi:hypothetical protein
MSSTPESNLDATLLARRLARRQRLLRQARGIGSLGERLGLMLQIVGLFWLGRWLLAESHGRLFWGLSLFCVLAFDVLYLSSRIDGLLQWVESDQEAPSQTAG